MAYGPGVNEINYSDLPPTGDTVNSAFQKTQNQFDALYTGLNGDIVRATEADVNTAIDTTKLVTPGTLLKGKVNGVASLDALGKVTGTELPLASTTVKGVMELATSAEVLAGTDNERAVTPAGLSYWSKTPVGAIVTYPVDSIPAHCLECNGAAISRETYPELFAAIGTTYGEGDGSTTFKIPDLRGEFIRGWDHSRGIDIDRTFGSWQEDLFKSHTHSFTGGEAVYAPAGAGSQSTMLSTRTTSATGGVETRPRNVAMMYCIVYE